MNFRKCSICGNTKEVWRFKSGNLYCKKHYHQMNYFGEIRNGSQRRKDNIFETKSDITEIHFDSGELALIDTEDLKFIKQCYWGFDGWGYLHGRINGKLARMHRHLLGFPSGVVDHINRNKMDNRKANLRIGTQRDNSRNLSIAKNNTSGATGVYRIKDSKVNNWTAEIMVNRNKVYLGRFETIDEAKKVRKQAEIKYFGEYAPN